jgi:bacterioferritin-associated ferredoxin
VTTAVNKGACTSKQVAAACGAGSDCGRCKVTVRALIAATLAEQTAVAS